MRICFSASSSEKTHATREFPLPHCPAARPLSFEPLNFLVGVVLRREMQLSFKTRIYLGRSQLHRLCTTVSSFFPWAGYKERTSHPGRFRQGNLARLTVTASFDIER
jgi:hypothetical protein